MNSEEEAMIDAFKSEDEYLQEMQLKTNRYWREHKLPTDVPAWLVRAEAEFKEKVPKLPDELQGKFQGYAKDQIRQARHCIECDDKEGLAMALMLVDVNIETVRHNIRLARDNARQDGTTKDRSPEVTQWIIDRLTENPKITAAKLFEKWENEPYISMQYEITSKRSMERRVTKARKIIKNSTQ